MGGEVTRGVGGWRGKELARWTIMGRKAGETWKAEAKPAKKEPEWELL